MTRIVAGTARGRRLKVPPAVTRPTSDRVREAVFSSLEAALDLSGARVLDLFAGSGALGLEAASRGATRVLLVDSSALATKVMAQNVRAVGLPGVTISQRRVRDLLATGPQPFDVVFMDPPYDVPRDQVDGLLQRLVQGWLATQAVVVVERGTADKDLTWPAGFADPWDRAFGGTHVSRAVWYGLEDL